MPFVKVKIEKLTDDYLNLNFNKKLENHKSQLQKENDKYRTELEESLEVIRKEHSQDLINYNLFTNQKFIIYPKLYGLIQKSLKDLWLDNTIYPIPAAEKSKNSEELKQLLLQLEATNSEIEKLTLNFERKESSDFYFDFIQFYSNLKRRKTMEKNDVAFSYFLENKIYFSQEMIDLVQTFYLNLKEHSEGKQISPSENSLECADIFLTTNNTILTQMNKELQNKIN